MKSNVSDCLEMASRIYIDACAKCIAEVSDFRDLETIRSRVKKEGLSFLTITLPSFCADFERSLADGCIDPTSFRMFRKNGSIPVFLQGMTGLIFDRETGRLYEEQNLAIDTSVLVDSVRQICLTFKKIEIVCTPQRVQAAIASFSTVERDLSTFVCSEEDTRSFSEVSFVLWSDCIRNIVPSELLPRHGPGATAEHISGNQKFAPKFWHDRLEPFLPLIDNVYSINAIESKELEIVTIIAQDEEQPVRVTPVPKTMKGPRIIAIEPCCMQYAQQAVRGALYSAIEQSRFAAGHVNFRDQAVNQAMALTSSKDGLLATIDLSDASDRVPRNLALEMFRSNPDLRDMIDACRSTRAELPGGTIVGPLYKFASMGSALCFPVESMYFYTICVAALLKARNLPITSYNCKTVARDVYVYGDDIIVPSTNAIIVLDYLQKYNCKVNTSKTFYTGRFRESCGVDAYLGEPVTPVYLRRTRPENVRQAPEVISWMATANSFYLKGYWHTATLMFTALEKVLGPLPFVSPKCPGLGRVTLRGYRSIERWNRSLHRFEVKTWVPRPVYRSDNIDGYSALTKCLSRGLEVESLDDPVPVDRHHLERSALHGAVVLQRRWVPST